MAQITYDLIYENNEGLVMSPSYLIDKFFYGVSFCAPDGRIMTEDDIKAFIFAGQAEVERWLGIKLQRQIISESKDFVLEDWRAWGFIRSTYPIVQPFTLDGYVNTIRQVQYPPEWLSVRKTNDGKLYQKNLYLVPVGSAVANFQSIVFSGITPHLGFLNMPNIPNYWQMVYGTGFNEIPADILKVIGYLAAIPVYMFLGNGLLLLPGMNSYSISIDGLSQSKSIEAGGYTTRVNQMLAELYGANGRDGLLKQLKEYYNSFNLNVC